MVDTIDLLRYQSLTAAINEIKSPNSFIFNLLFRNHETLLTETVELSTKIGARKIAPMVRKNGEAIMIQGTTAGFATLECPNIRIKMPFSAGELIFQRRPGVGIYDTAQIENAAKAKIATDLAYMADQIANAEELMAAQVLQGKISYSVNEGDQFQATVPRDAGLSVDESGSNPWASGSVRKTVVQAKRDINRFSGVSLTHCIMSESASEQFQKNSEIQALLDNRNITAGDMTLVEQFTDQGALYLGRAFGVSFWEYSRTAQDVTGADVAMIRDKWVEFVSTSPAAEFTTYYGAIPEENGDSLILHTGERFAKSWTQKDPATLMALAHSRPLPWAKRANCMKSVKVVA